MTKTDLVNYIAEETGLSKADAARALEAVITGVTAGLKKEGKVTVTAIYNKITNPETVSACHIVLGIILLISIGTLIVNKQKTVKNNKRNKGQEEDEKIFFLFVNFL